MAQQQPSGAAPAPLPPGSALIGQPNTLEAKKLALACLAFALYGSFVPFHYQWRPFDDAVATYRSIVFAPFALSAASFCR